MLPQDQTRVEIEAHAGKDVDVVQPMISAEWASAILAFVAFVFVVWEFISNRRSNEKQLRAYVFVDPGGVNEAQGGMFRLPYKIKNTGQTPAYDLSVFGDVVVIEGDPRDFDPAKHGRLGKAEASTDISLGSGDLIWNYAVQPVELIAERMESIQDKTAAIIHYGFVEYRDAFGKKQRTHFAYYHWGDHLSDVESKRCRFGNSAT